MFVNRSMTIYKLITLTRQMRYALRYERNIWRSRRFTTAPFADSAGARRNSCLARRGIVPILGAIHKSSRDRSGLGSRRSRGRLGGPAARWQNGPVSADLSDWLREGA